MLMFVFVVSSIRRARSCFIWDGCCSRSSASPDCDLCLALQGDHFRTPGPIRMTKDFSGIADRGGSGA